MRSVPPLSKKIENPQILQLTMQKCEIHLDSAARPRHPFFSSRCRREKAASMENCKELPLQYPRHDVVPAMRGPLDVDFALLVVGLAELFDDRVVGFDLVAVELEVGAVGPEVSGSGTKLHATKL